VHHRCGPFHHSPPNLTWDGSWAEVSLRRLLGDLSDVSIRPLPSLRLWLQSTTLLAVIAGYSLLVAMDSVISERERRAQHQRLVEALISLEQSQRLPRLSPVDADGDAPLLRWRVLPGRQPQPITRTGGSDGPQELVSRRPLPGVRAAPLTLEVRQNITASLQQQRSTQLLLVAAAGVSALFTSLLLRLVLRRGLVQPLQALAADVASLEADHLGEHWLPVAQQSQELQPIARAFNELQQRLALAWQQERTFIDGVAHELRTPITVISGHAQRLQRCGLPIELQEPLRLIAAEAARMGTQLSILRDLARSDAGRLQPQWQSLDPDEQLLLAFERWQARSPARLTLPVPERTPPQRIQADPELLQQCLDLLIDNALRYSSDSVALQRSVGTTGETILHVLDRGPGIPVAERHQVVRRFARGSSSSGTRGMGIGLALASALVAALRAQLRIAARTAGGADLQVVFRAAPPAP
jgi:two-component system, OmpR family, sensor kinase